MTKQQQMDLDAQLRQQPLDLQAGLNDLRVGFEQAMSQLPIGDRIRKTQRSLGGVNTVSRHEARLLCPRCRPRLSGMMQVRTMDFVDATETALAHTPKGTRP